MMNNIRYNLIVFFIENVEHLFNSYHMYIEKRSDFDGDNRAYYD